MRTGRRQSGDSRARTRAHTYGIAAFAAFRLEPPHFVMLNLFQHPLWRRVVRAEDGP